MHSFCIFALSQINQLIYTMKRRTLLLGTIGAMTLLSVGCQNVPAPEPVYPLPTQAQVNWQKMETYAFVHFGLNTFNNMEWGFGDTPESTFDPTDLNVGQWVETLKNAGMKGIIITVKHHDGFCLWPTKNGDYSVKNSPVQNGQSDLVRDLVEACKKEDLKIGIYISPWDRNHAKYGEKEYVDYFQSTIKEMVEDYCAANGVELFEFWFDGANGGDGYYGGERGVRNINPTEYYRYEEAANTIHSKFPDAMIFGGTVPTIRWIGNEHGYAGQTNWAMWGKGLPESRKLENGDINGPDWLPGEVDVSVRPGWFYHTREDHQLRSLSTLVDYYYQSVGRNANLLLNFPINHAGRIPTSDSIRIMEWKKTLDRQFANDLAAKAKFSATNERGRGYQAAKVNDGNWDTYWATQDGVTTGDIIASFDAPTEFNTVLLQEYIPLGQRIKSFTIEYKNDKNEFVPVASKDTMSTVGYKRLIRFDNVTTKELKISFTDSRGVPCINNISIYSAPAVLDVPKIVRSADGKVNINSAKGTVVYYTIDGTEPTTASLPFSAPFEFAQKGIIKAVAYDPTTNEPSPVGTQLFDIVQAPFEIMKPIADKGNKHAFDGNPSTSYYLPKGTNSLTFSLGGKYNICGLEYTPDQNRWGAGPIHRYKIYIDNKFIKEGEFSNIKQNPIKQYIEFPQTEGSNITVEVLRIADDTNRASFAELSVITE